MTILETKQPMTAYLVTKIHEECNAPLQFTGDMFATNPPKYKHVCMKCGERFNFGSSYPTIQYAPVLGANSNSPIAPG